MNPQGMPSSRHIFISDTEGSLPYSKGLMASSIMATGLAPSRAFHAAERVEELLHEQGVDEISRPELLATAERVIGEEEGREYADAYRRWHIVKKLDQPLVILIGGSAGVGKSTIATQLGARLGINRIIPTDAIREVMRAMLEEELAPALHTSSFDADRLVRQPLPRRVEPLLVGFREQSMMVGVGIQALVRRAIDEGAPLILEGVHVVPGAFDTEELGEDAIVVQLLVTIDSEDVHRSHFQIRSDEMRRRPLERYLDNFERIRTIQTYLVSLAEEHGTPVVTSYDLDSTLSQILDLVVTEATRGVPAGGRPGQHAHDPDQARRPMSSVQGSGQ